MSHYLKKLQSKLSPGVLFPQKPLIRFAPNQDFCPGCDSVSRVWKTHTREVATLRIGHFIAHETQTYCPGCADQPVVFLAEELQQLVPPGARYGYDVIAFIGQAIFLHCRNGKEIQEECHAKNIAISLREIDYLGRRFIVYLALAHEQSQQKIKQFMSAQGGYILHLDGTCEGDGHIAFLPLLGCHHDGRKRKYQNHCLGTFCFVVVPGLVFLSWMAVHRRLTIGIQCI